MNFYVKKRSKPTVPIITLIDILAILLIYFIVTTTFKRPESLLKVNLPKSGEQLAGKGSSDSRIPLALAKNGDISLGADILTIEQVPAALQKLKQEQPGVKLEMKADSETPLGLMVQLWDAATKAGVEINDIPLRIRVEK